MPPRVTGPDFIRSCGLQGLAALRLSGAPLQVGNEWTTLRALQERRASLARFGDGELEIMIGRGIHFQEYDPELARRLRAVLHAPSRDFLVGVPNFSALQINTRDRQRRWKRYQCMYSHLIRRNAQYHSAFVTRPGAIVGLESAEYFRFFESLWTGRNVVLVHHAAAAADSSLFLQVRRVHHVPCPAQHAFREYAALLKNASAFLGIPDVLFLIAAGPTAGVLAWDLAQRGAQALDIGHLTNAYEQFLQNP